MQSTLLAFNFLPIKTAWQIGLHEPKPLVGLSSSYNTYTAVSPVNGLVFHSAYIAPRFNAFLAQTRQNLDPDEEVIFIYDSAPAHRNPANPAANTKLQMLPAYSTFLNIVEQAISSLKAAIKGDISRPEIQTLMDDRAEARRLGIPLGEMRTRLLLDALQRCIGAITAAKAYQWFRFMQTY